ncbi:MAG TPA: hypothetical protein VEY12_03475 [Thermoplasmata archaeon]|nr:hypothetical protein [Thermoplasmata archaeon]
MPPHGFYVQLTAAVVVALVALTGILVFASLPPGPEPDVVLVSATTTYEGCSGGMTTYNYSFRIVNPRASYVRAGLEVYADNMSTGISYFYLRPRSTQAAWMYLGFVGCGSHVIRGNLTLVQDIPSTWMPTSVSGLGRNE